MRAGVLHVHSGGKSTLLYSLSNHAAAQALPDTEAEVQARLQELYAEIAPLANQKHKIDSRAARSLSSLTFGRPSCL